MKEEQVFNFIKKSYDFFMEHPIVHSYNFDNFSIYRAEQGIDVYYKNCAIIYVQCIGHKNYILIGHKEFTIPDDFNHNHDALSFTIEYGKILTECVEFMPFIFFKEYDTLISLLG